MERSLLHVRGPSRQLHPGQINWARLKLMPSEDTPVYARLSLQIP